MPTANTGRIKPQGRRGTGQVPKTSRTKKAPNSRQERVKLLEVKTPEEQHDNQLHIKYHINPRSLQLYIEQYAKPLWKIMQLANGEKINNWDKPPSQDVQLKAIYELLKRVAPELKSLEVRVEDNPEGQGAQQAQILSNILQGLAHMANTRRAGPLIDATAESIRGQSQVASDRKT